MLIHHLLIHYEGDSNELLSDLLGKGVDFCYLVPISSLSPSWAALWLSDICGGKPVAVANHTPFDINEFIKQCVCVLVTQSCLTLYDPMDCSLPGSSVRVILQARILEWVGILFSRGSS